MKSGEGIPEEISLKTLSLFILNPNKIRTRSTSLKKLKLTSTTRSGYFDLELDCPNLEVLFFYAANVTTKSLNQVLSRCNQLRVLGVFASLVSFSYHVTTKVDNSFQGIPNATNLTEIHIHTCSLSQDDVDCFAECKNLEKLILQGYS